MTAQPLTLEHNPQAVADELGDTTLLSSEEEERALKLRLRLKLLGDRKIKQESFIDFVKAVWPDFIAGPHHKIFADKLDRVAKGELKRLIINMPPRHTKSEFASFLFPAYKMGRDPSCKIIQATHTTDLAVDFGRKVKNLLDSEAYTDIFEEVKLAPDAKASGRWNTTLGGMYYAVGVGTNLAGRGGDLIIIDDPHSEQTATAAAFQSTWEWYTGGPRQRVQPGAAIIVVMCMTGDTPVLMADGLEVPLRDIRVGDEVATYDDGELTTTKVLNWRSNGIDSIYKVQTSSGTILRANERHPFLVDTGGERTWVRLKNLRKGMKLVGIGSQKGTGKGKPAQKRVATVLSPVKDFARAITTKLIGHPVGQSSLQTSGEQLESSTATGSHWSSLRRWWSGRGGNALFATSPLLIETPEHIGTGSSALTTAMTREQSGVFSAMTAILRSVIPKRQRQLGRLPSTSNFTTETVVLITPDGLEEVFDLQIERTENFIANGVVSHNTRWDERDLTGKLVKQMANNPKADQWEVVEFPFELPSGNPVWPQYWSKEELEGVKNSIPPYRWNAQYQQQPTGETNAIIKRENWKIWPHKFMPRLDYILQSFDTAYSKNEQADYSAITTWGVFNPREYFNDCEVTRALILLDAKKGRWDFHILKEEALKNYKYWEPDMVLIEGKASGMPLTHELRNIGIPVVNFTPARGNDKIARMNAVQPVFASGMVYAPEDHWAKEVIEEVAGFPNAEFDDYADSTTQAVSRFRQGGFVKLPTDAWDDEEEAPRRRTYY